MGGPLALGPFALDVPIGRGGMGQVWRAQHVAQQVPVAVKVITSERALSRLYLSAFKNEVRSTAGLDHPSIVRVLDYGEIPEETASASGGRFVAGSPFLVMELLDGGSLDRLRGRMSWPELRLTLLVLLDALAHAHARGMIHRDIKPANVILDHSRRLVKLTDFGLAHAVRDEGPAGERKLRGGVGTPAYMPPEQIERRWRDYGPWTDLYALGCLAYELVSGHTPFGRAAEPATYDGHLGGVVPPLEPRFEVPRALEDWIGRLLEKDPHDRFRRAADASFALLGLPGGEDPASISSLLELGAGDRSWVLPGGGPSGATLPLNADPDQPTQAATSVFGEPRSPRESSALLEPRSPGEADPVERPRAEREGRVGSRPGAPARRSPAARPPLPASWRPKVAPGPALRLLDAGLGLYGLRTIPLVGRERERERLWAELTEVHERARPRVVILEGPTGCGKTRLSEWLAERAHEAGAATVLLATATAEPNLGDPIATMVARSLRVVGLPRAEVAERVRAELDRDRDGGLDEVLALTELVSPAREEPGPAREGRPQSEGRPKIVRFASGQERQVLALRHLARLARERPLIVRLEDAIWGAEVLSFVELALELEVDRAFPVLFLLTVREEALAGGGPEVAQLERIARSESAVRIHVDALEPELRPVLVRELLGLEGELAGRVEERTAGNPLFAVQLVGDLIQRDVLVPGRAGFRLRPGAQLELPDDLHQVWSAHLDRLLAGRPPDDRRALELAAVLGQDIDAAEWRVVLERAGAHPTGSLVETLIVERLARSGDRGPEVSWSFVHGMLRESLERRARDEGRWRGYNHVCAEVVRFRTERGARERFGRHLLEAGHASHAIEPLTQGGLERLDAGEYRLAEALFADRERALREIDLPPTDPRWGEGYVHRGRLAVLLGDHAAGEALLRDAAKEARAHDWPLVSGMAHRELGRLARIRGDHKNGALELELAQAFAQRVGDVRLRAECRRDVAYLHLARGRLDLAEEDFRRAREDYESLRDPLGEARCDIGLGELLREAGRLEEARALALRARTGFERSGSRKGESECWNALGEIARLGGDLESAEACYREALEIRRALGAANAIICELNLGLVLVERGAFLEARETHERCLRTVERQLNKRMMACIHVCLLPAAIALGDPGAFDRHLRSAAALLGETGFVDVDNARMAELAGDLAGERGARDHAREAYAIARHQWRALGRVADGERLEAKVRRL